MGRGRTWTDEEDELFLSMVASGYTDVEIAIKLDRSYHAVQARRYRHGIIKRKYLDMTTNRVNAIEQARERGWTWQQIGDKLGFHPWVLSRRYRMAKGAKL